MKIKTKKKRIIALMMCLLMVATLFQGNGFKALADVIDGEGAPSGEVATVGDAEEIAGEASFEEASVETSNEASSEESSLMMVYENIEAQAMTTSEPGLVEETIVPQGANQSLTIRDVNAKLNGVELTDGMQVNNGDILAVTIEWKIPNAADDRDPSYIYEYTIDTKGIEIPDITDYSVVWEGNVVGKYSIHGGILTLQITDTNFLKRSDVEGQITLNGKIDVNSSDIDEEGKSLVKIATKQYNLKVNSTPSSVSKVNTWKSATEKKLNDEGKVVQTFQISIESVGDNTNFSLTDTPGSYLSILPGTIKLKDNSNNLVDSSRYSASGSSTGFNFSMPQLNAGERFYLTYDAIIDGDAYSDSTLDANKLTNTYDFTYKNSENENYTPQPYEKQPCIVSINKPSVTKGGSYDSTSKEFTWTVRIYGNDLGLDSATLKDTFKNLDLQTVDNAATANIRYVDYNWQQQTATTTVGDLVAGYTFTNPFAAPKKVKEIEVTYKTKLNPTAGELLNSQEVENDVNVNISGKDYPAVGKAYISEAKILTKDCVTADNTWETVGTDTGLIKWTSTIKIPANTTLTDVVYEDSITGNHTFFKVDSIVPAVGYGVTGTAGANNFKITFTDSLVNSTSTDKDVVITYYTKATNKEEMGVSIFNDTYPNTGNLSFMSGGNTYNRQSSDSFNYKVSNIVSKTGSGYPLSNLKLDKDEMLWMLNIDLIGIDPSKTYTITDTFPNYLKYATGTAIVYNAEDSWRIDNYNDNLRNYGTSPYAAPITPTSTSDGSVVFKMDSTFLAAYAGKKIVIAYLTEYKDQSSYYANAGKNETNNVKITEDVSGSTMGLSSHTQRVNDPSDIVQKTVSYNSLADPFVYYSIDINPDAADLLEGGDTITVIDKMGTALSLKPGTVQIVDEVGNAIAGSTYDYDVEHHKAVFTIPDSKHVIIKYAAVLDEAVGTNLSTMPDSEVGNEVTIQGYTSDKASDSVRLNSSVMQSSGIGYGQNSSITLYKYNSNISNALGGAKFKIDMVVYDPVTGTTSDALPGSGPNAVAGGVTGYEGPQYVTTSVDGTTVVDGLLHDKIYRITETQAPSGYKKAVPYYFLIEGDDHATLPAALTPNSAFKTAGQIIYIEDEAGDDEEVAFEFRKLNNSSETVSGAVYKFYKETSTTGVYETTEALTVTTANVNTVINVLKSTDTTGEFTNELYAGTYKLVEESAPAGYSIAAPLKVVITEAGKVTVTALDGSATAKANATFVTKTKADSTTYDYYTLGVTDDKVSVKFEKKVSSNGSTIDATPTYFLNGAKLTLTYTDPVTSTVKNVEIASTDDTAVEIKDLYRNVEYKLEETTVPTGYNKAEDIRFKINDDGSITVISGVTGNLNSCISDTSIGDKSHTVTMVDTIGGKNITFKKTDESGNPLNGAELRIYLASDTARTGSYISIGGATASSKIVVARIDGNLVAGTLKYGEKYVLVEYSAPAGYAYSEDMPFEISATGDLVVNNAVQAGAELVMADKPYEVCFGKYSRVTNNRLGNASFTITDVTDSSVVATWTSSATEDKVISGTKFKIGRTYKLTENAVPSGDGNTYIKMKDVYFTIGRDGKAAFVTTGTPSTDVSRIGVDISIADNSSAMKVSSVMSVINEVTVPGNFLISKRLAAGTSYGSEELTGITFELYKADSSYNKTGTPVETWTTGTSAKSFWVFETDTDLNNDITANPSRGGTRLVEGKYVLVEKSAPVGYVKESVTEYPIEISVTGYPEDVTSVLVGIVSVNYHGTKPDSFKAENGQISVVSGGVTYTNNNIVITNKKKQLRIAKAEADGTTALAGAKLELQKTTDGGATWIAVAGEGWTTDGTYHPVDIEKLGVGEFRLIEKAAPKGYAIANPIEFKITDDNQGSLYLKENGVYKSTPELESSGVIALAMKDARLSLSISKKNTENVALAGVEYKIVDVLAGTDIITGLTTDASGIITLVWTNQLERLTTDKEYKLVETVAKTGYTYGKDVTFKIKDDGKVELVGDYTGYASVIPDTTQISLKDKKIELKVLKVKDDMSTVIPGAKFRIYNADYSVNVQCTSNSSGYLEADIISGQTETDITTYLKAGETYSLYEYQAPSGYAQAGVVTFKIDKNGKVTVNGTEQLNNKIIVVNQEIGIRFDKIDDRGNKVVGARMSIEAVDSVEVSRFNGGSPYTFTTDIVPHNVSATMFKEGQYYRLKELEAPNGYAVLDSYQGNGILFRYLGGKPVLVNQTNGSSIVSQVVSGYTDSSKVLATSIGTTLSAVDIPLELYISKTDITTANDVISREIAGAQMKLLDSANNVVETWTSETSAHMVDASKLKAGNTYTLVETIAPDGMAVTTAFIFTIDENGKVAKVNSTDTNAVISKYGSSNNDNWVKLVDNYLTLKVKKYGKSSNGTLSDLAGAKLELYKVVRGVAVKVYEFTSTTGEQTIPNEHLVGGTTYIIKETQAPTGYAIAEDITFTINPDGTITQDGSVVAANTIKVIDEEIGVMITKEDMGGTTLPGATLRITSDEDAGFSTLSWVSTTTPKNLSLTLFQPDKEYILTETIAPYGYDMAESITFKIDSVGNVLIKKADGTFAVLGSDTIVMKDAPAKIKLSKTDITNGAELPGATIKITDASGNDVVSGWVSGSTPKEIDVLTFAKDTDYYFTEVTAPYGYDVAETIVFKIADNNKVYIKNANGTYTALGSSTIVMKDAPAKIKLSKTDITNGAELPGATIKITDASGNDVVSSWVSGSTPKEIDVLTFAKDTDYYFTEVTAPYGYDVAETIVFKIGEDNKISIKNTDGTYTALDSSTIVMKDAPAKIKLSKTDITNGAELPGATIKITDASGNDVVSSWVSGSTPKEIDVLTFAKDTDYYFTEVTAPYGYDVAETIVFKIGENNKIYIKNADGTYTALDTNTIVMKDKPTETSGVTTETTTESTTEITTTETATSDKTTTITTTSSEVKTGDTTPVKQVCILMLISVVGMLGLGILIRLNKKDEE